MGRNHQQMTQERQYHEDDDRRRDESRLIVGTYASDLFAEAESHHLALAGIMPNLRVLDYGCGTGESTLALARLGASVVGFDISRRRISEARIRCAHLPGVSFVQCAAEELPFEDSTFDVVIGKQILHHLDLKVAIPEVARVLRPGGRAVFLEPLGHNPALEMYRRLTPGLRSPTERALRVADLAFVASHFRRSHHTEFCFTCVVPALIEAMMPSRVRLGRLKARLRDLDAWLLARLPAIGRYYWVTVSVFEA